ncbi:MAG: putative toxin-antitoxin system toxin component, PIN family [Rubrivivax sp.]|nr:MAG: putative toxin-antitoxin system toxin component, PIN family [Rubrivivax sp.]
MRGKPRLVLDTNVVVSAFLWQGTPGRLIELAGEKEAQLFTSRALLDELAATLAKKKLAKYVAATGLTVEQMLANYRRIAKLVTANQLEQQVSRDIDDDAVLACALAARADLIVSGDDAGAQELQRHAHLDRRAGGQTSWRLM